MQFSHIAVKTNSTAREAIVNDTFNLQTSLVHQQLVFSIADYIDNFHRKTNKLIIVVCTELQYQPIYNARMYCTRCLDTMTS